MKKISIIVPCFNEEETIELFYNAVKDMWKEKMTSYEAELVFVDDGSKDRTHEILKQLAAKDEEVRYTSFSRNFGKEAAIFCGLKQATGDAAVVLDADLQHPVATIADMAAKWEEGYKVVEGFKKNRGKEKKTHGFFAGLFYGMISKMIGFDMQNSSDFKLIDRQVIDVLNDMTEKDTFFRAMSFWVGFSSTTVEYEVAERAGGSTKWSTFSLFKYAVKNLTSFTYTPLYIIGFLGGVVFLIGLALGIDAVVTYFTQSTVGGYPTLVVLIVLATGAIMLSLGIISVYIAKMFDELKDRPRFIVQDKK